MRLSLLNLQNDFRQHHPLRVSIWCIMISHKKEGGKGDTKRGNFLSSGEHITRDHWSARHDLGRITWVRWLCLIPQGQLVAKAQVKETNKGDNLNFSTNRQHSPVIIARKQRAATQSPAMWWKDSWQALWPTSSFNMLSGNLITYCLQGTF